MDGANWVASDERRELGDRVRWFLVDAEHAPRERYWKLVLTWPADRTAPRAIVDAPVQMRLLDVGPAPSNRTLDLGPLTPVKAGAVWRFRCGPCAWEGEGFAEEQLAKHDAILHLRGSIHGKARRSVDVPVQMRLETA